jgi:hypothetical protein
MNAENDYASVRIAAREFLEESWAFIKIRSLRSAIANREELIRKSLPKRTVSEGYYRWVEYLAWLSVLHEFVRFRDLTAAEAIGLRIVAEARDEFLSAHPKCSKCGATNDKYAMRCSACKSELK